MTISSKIKKTREKKGFSQEYMAENLNISQSAYSKLERRDKAINIEKLIEISRLLEVDPMDFFTKSDDVTFNNCNQSGYNNHNYLPEKLISLFENQIKEQQKEIDYLRKIVDKGFFK